MAVALADSLFLSITPGEARSRVILFLAVSFAPFVVLGRFIGPVIDRMPGGRRLLVVLIAALRAVVMVLMVWQLDSLFLFPLAFLAMVLNKTYGVSKSAMLPTLTRSESDLVEANAKLGVTAGIVGFLAAVPAGVLSLVSAKATLVFGAAMFVLATLQAVRIPKRSVARDEPAEIEIVELRQAGVIVASSAMGLIRASVGFLFFHLAFWFADPQRSQVVGISENGLWRQTEYHFGPQFGTFWFGVAVSLAAVGTLLGNLSAKSLKRFPKVESLLIVGLVIIGVAGAAAAVAPLTIVALLAAALVNFAAAIGNMAFETIVQRDAPDANRGRALANFATRFQFMWVGAGLVPVVLDLPGVVGFAMVSVIGLAGAAAYLFGMSQLAKGTLDVPKLRHYVRRRITRVD